MSVTSGGLNIITTGSGEQVISTGLYKQGKMVLTMVNIASVTDGDNVAKTVCIFLNTFIMSPSKYLCYLYSSIGIIEENFSF